MLLNYAKNIALSFSLMLVCSLGASQYAPIDENSSDSETLWDSNVVSPVTANNLEGVSIESYYESEKDSLSSDANGQIDVENTCQKQCCEKKCCGKGKNSDEKEPYFIKTGDRFLISVYNEPSTKRIVTVDPSGSISYLLFNSAHVEGMTIDELRRLIQDKLGTYYKDPLVIINPSLFAGEYYTVMGEVRKPGNKLVEGNPTVLTALAQSGGFTTRIFRNQTVDQADLDHSFLSRKGEFLPVDFNRLVKYGDITQDIPLKTGDYIYIAPTSISRVYVLGEVYSPATVDFLDSLSLLEAIAEVGGTSPYASSRIAVIRGSLCCPVRYLIDINRIQKGCAPDFPLMAGDIVYVPTMQYTTAKEIFRAATVNFVSTLASIAGTSTFIAVHPHAGVTGVLSPVPILNTGTGVNFVSTPILGPAATSPAIVQ